MPEIARVSHWAPIACGPNGLSLPLAAGLDTPPFVQRIVREFG